MVQAGLAFKISSAPLATIEFGSHIRFALELAKMGKNCQKSVLISVKTAKNTQISNILPFYIINELRRRFAGHLIPSKDTMMAAR